MDAWKIAAAILIERNESLHYTELTKLVLQTNLSRLGNSSKGTEHKTLDTYMTRDHKDFFLMHGSGFFSINRDKINDPSLNLAKSKYQEFLRKDLENKQEKTAHVEIEKLDSIEKQQMEDDNLLHVVTNDIDSFNYENIAIPEGSISKRFVSYYERNPKLRAAALKIHGIKCMVPNCSFDFEKIYGIRGQNYIEVHHIKPLSSMITAEKINPETDLVVVCSNCHRIIHREKNNILSIEEVNELITNNKKI